MTLWLLISAKPRETINISSGEVKNGMKGHSNAKWHQHTEVQFDRKMAR
jgi:hypothetical protein